MVVDHEKIKENDFNLNVTLYVFPKEETEEIDIEKEWQDMPLKHSWCKTIGVKSSNKDSSYKPSVVLDFRGLRQYTQLEIRNSHLSANLRTILVLIKAPCDYIENNLLNKPHDIFQAEIKIINTEAALAKFIEDCKREARKTFGKESYLRNQKHDIGHKGVFSYLFSHPVNHDLLNDQVLPYVQTVS